MESNECYNVVRSCAFLRHVACCIVAFAWSGLKEGYTFIECVEWLKELKWLHEFRIEAMSKYLMQEKTVGPLISQKFLKNVIFEANITGSVKSASQYNVEDFRKY